MAKQDKIRLVFRDKVKVLRLVEENLDRIKDEKMTKKTVADFASNTLGFEVRPTHLTDITDELKIDWPREPYERKRRNLPYDREVVEKIVVLLDELCSELGHPCDEDWYGLVAKTKEDIVHRGEQCQKK